MKIAVRILGGIIISPFILVVVALFLPFYILDGCFSLGACGKWRPWRDWSTKETQELPPFTKPPVRL